MIQFHCPRQCSLVLASEVDVPGDVVLGIVLILTTIFGGVYILGKISRYMRQNQTQTVGPHVIMPIRKVYEGRPKTIYRCKYCAKERERKVFFRYEDCDEFKAD